MATLYAISDITKKTLVPTIDVIGSPFYKSRVRVFFVLDFRGSLYLAGAQADIIDIVFIRFLLVVLLVSWR